MKQKIVYIFFIQFIFFNVSKGDFKGEALVNHRDNPIYNSEQFKETLVKIFGTPKTKEEVKPNLIDSNEKKTNVKQPEPVDDNGEISKTIELDNVENIRGKAVCYLQHEIGLCRAAVPSFYYDLNENKCKEFTYGGCDGNGNRFGTKKDCETRCKN